MFGVSPKMSYKRPIGDGWNTVDMNTKPIAFQSENFFNDNGEWNGINTKHFKANIDLEVDLLLDIDNKKLNACVVGQCIEGKEVKIWDFEVPSDGLVPYFNLHNKGQQLKLLKIPIEWYGISQMAYFLQYKKLMTKILKTLF